MYTRLHVKCPVFLSCFNETWIFVSFSKNAQNINFHENPSSMNGQAETDRHDEDKCHPSQFCKRPKKKKSSNFHVTSRKWISPCKFTHNSQINACTAHLSYCVHYYSVHCIHSNSAPESDSSLLYYTRLSGRVIWGINGKYHCYWNMSGFKTDVN